MITLLDDLFGKQLPAYLVFMLILTLCNGFLLFLIVFFILRKLKAVPARHRHLVWFFVICSFLIIPLMSYIVPSFDLPPQKIPVSRVLGYGEAAAKPAVPQSEVSQPVSMPDSLQAAEAVGGAPAIRWRILALGLWLTGVFLFLMRILVGRIGLLCLTRSAAPVSDRRSTAAARSVFRHFGMRKKVALWTSSHCITPFTCYLFKPAVFLPSTIGSWSRERLRAVLLHELAHIKRKDHIVRYIARVLCAVFWLAPPIWIAYRNLQVEEEKACDALVVHGGITPSSYAKHIIDIVRATRGAVLTLGLRHAFGSRGTLYSRIRNILRLNARTRTGRIGGLIRVLAVCFLCLPVLQVVNPLNAMNGGFIRSEAPLELLYGRWVNDRLDFSKWEDFQGDWYRGKMVVDPEGKVHWYQTPDSPEMSHVGGHARFTVTDSCTDREGNRWFRGYSVCLQWANVFYYFWRIDPSGTVLESMHSFTGYPAGIRPDDCNYSIYYREEK